MFEADWELETAGFGLGDNAAGEEDEEEGGDGEAGEGEEEVRDLERAVFVGKETGVRSGGGGGFVKVEL